MCLESYFSWSSDYNIDVDALHDRCTALLPDHLRRLLRHYLYHPCSAQTSTQSKQYLPIIVEKVSERIPESLEHFKSMDHISGWEDRP